MSEDERAAEIERSSAGVASQNLDLVVTVLLALLAGVAALLPGIAETPIRFVLGIPFLVFVPGYALVSALFPRTESADSTAEASAATYVGGRIGVLERIALSVGTSVAVVSLIGYVLSYTPWEIRLVPILVGVCCFTGIAALVAVIRRARTPEEVRFSVSGRVWSGRLRSALTRQSRTDVVLNAVLALSLILAAGSVAYAVTSPNSDSFTQFYVLAENESGTPVADGYPRNVTVGETQSLPVGIDNHEGRRVTYTVVVLLQQVDNETNTVLETERVGQTRTALGPNRTKVVRPSFTPTIRGDGLRLTYLLYRGDPPANPSLQNAYRSVYVHVNASS